MADRNRELVPDNLFIRNEEKGVGEGEGYGGVGEGDYIPIATLSPPE